jgi:hypothetical protein
MKVLSIVLLIILFVSQCYAQPISFNKKPLIKLRCLSDFIDRNEGDVAFLPGVGHEAYVEGAQNYHVFPESGFYELPKKGNYFFRVNHYAADTEKTSYLGVTVCLIFRSGSGEKKGYFLTRNKARWEPGKGRKLLTELSGPKYFPLDAQPYFEAHKQGSLIRCDELLNFTWHAAIENGPNSWDYRNKWASAEPSRLGEFIKLLGIQEDKYKIAITAYILEFTTSSSRKSGKPLYFWFNADNAVGAYVTIFSPPPSGTQFDKSFYIKFK